jgi:hypothetical protein
MIIVHSLHETHNHKILGHPFYLQALLVKARNKGFNSFSLLPTNVKYFVFVLRVQLLLAKLLHELSKKCVKTINAPNGKLSYHTRVAPIKICANM